MVLVVKCLICGKELNYSQSDPTELIQHVKTEHPLKKKSKADQQERVKNDLSQSLKRNSVSLKHLIDKEIQTEVDQKMSQGEKSKLNETFNSLMHKTSSLKGSKVSEKTPLKVKPKSPGKDGKHSKCYRTTIEK